MWKSNVSPNGVSSTCEESRGTEKPLKEHRGTANVPPLFPRFFCKSEMSDCGKSAHIFTRRSADRHKLSGMDGKPTRTTGAVKIENNAGRNFKELTETVRNAETLKRNNQERKGMLIGPSMAPRFSRSRRMSIDLEHQNLAARMAGRISSSKTIPESYNRRSLQNQSGVACHRPSPCRRHGSVGRFSAPYGNSP